jgi:hypothetical protein
MREMLNFLESNQLPSLRRSVRRVIVWSSGLDSTLLNRLSRPERSNSLAVGVVIVFSALLMAVGHGYAAYIIFSNSVASLVLGAVSGALLLALYRLILTTYAGEKVRRAVPLFGLGLPMMLAMFLMAVTTSVALSIGMFQNDIDRRISDSAAIGAQSFAERLAAQSSEIRSLESRIANAEVRVQQSLADYSAEVDGSAGSGMVGEGLVAALKRQRYEVAQAELNQLRPIVENQLQTLRAEQASLQERQRQYDSLKTHPGFLDRVAALKALEKENRWVAWAQLGIAFLVFFTSVSPLLIKMLSPVSTRALLSDDNPELIPLRISGTTTTAIGEATRQAFTFALERSSVNPSRSYEDL